MNTPADMSPHEEMADRHRRLLARVGDLSMSLAERLHEQAMAAETPAEAEGLALAFQRVSRSLRQTLALEARLERDRQRGLIEAERQAAEVRHTRVLARKKHVGDRGSRLIWTEAERNEIGPLLVKLTHWCDAAILDEAAFLEAPVEALIARLRRDLGLTAKDAAHDQAEIRSSA